MSPTVFAPWNDPDEKPLIRFKNVTKKFGEFVAIDDLSLDIYAQEFFALLGPSGCGKTTMMRMLAGFESPTTGRIELTGQDIAPVPPNKRAVNMMFQSYALFPHLSIWDNIAFGLRRDKMGKDAIAARVAEMLKLTRLEKFARRKPHQISGGQRQRVALARSLAKAPKLLLLDEPLGALDKKLRQDTQFELMDIQESTGTTFVIVTHDQEEAMTVASRVAVMDEGRVIQVATPAEIYEAPNSVYVADFIGDVNIIEASTKAIGQDQYHLNWIDGQPPLTATSAAPFSEGQQAHLAIRPEKIRISTERPEDAPNALQGKVLDIAYLGNLSTYHVELPGGQVIKAQTANTRRIARRDITWEDPVWISWSATAGVLLAQ
ncbi:MULTISPECIES: ABC transporter ATP-binding protein [Sulfitobacter]|uniref:ABC transporter ATP-binding protein n=1 Tax=Sulfitobacter TaxID=60136 RepID=UPI00230741D5|nr:MULTISPECIES: ABC transporter ATP-binding protein [Sulfitobacter]MDF3381670.1 ABC transporter ATP-binding protein [Sulfitobacter sp. Ks11]MDF3385089.1 ABC transporter ATP-binding protein [Sulfitobacter sp. M85]MDF3388508.1 ABC transporter ATP-binding protein [Sulfitobacter sp. Ks16]MDF3399145.1 ABC transporter ATP-binding protein [Sulfitobacter sp. KE39]MDF3402566.1 ABC transporter ATP-binding protein [Sulfitobacter sp. Ks35]